LNWALLAIISSEYTQRRIWRKLAYCRFLLIAVIMFAMPTLYVQPFDLTVNVQHKQPQQVIDFSLFLLVIYLLWVNFLIPEITSIHVTNTTKKTPCQPQSVHSLGLLLAENATLPQLHDFTLRTRHKWDLRPFGILRSVDW
jgi:hypothetical protein